MEFYSTNAITTQHFLMRAAASFSDSLGQLWAVTDPLDPIPTQSSETCRILCAPQINTLICPFVFQKKNAFTMLSTHRENLAILMDAAS